MHQKEKDRSQNRLCKRALRWIKLRLILRREENRRTPEKNPRSTGETNYNNSDSHAFHVLLRINMRLYPSGHPSSYNPVRPGLTWNSVVKGNALTASPNPCHPTNSTFLTIVNKNIYYQKFPNQLYSIYTTKIAQRLLHSALLHRRHLCRVTHFQLGSGRHMHASPA